MASCCSPSSSSFSSTLSHLHSHLLPPTLTPSSSFVFFSSSRRHSFPSRRLSSSKTTTLSNKVSFSTPIVSELQALIFDCDGVILESEDLHRRAYCDAFAHFNVRCPPDSDQPLEWTSAFYDVFQNTVGGGKPKMRRYFKDNGWPSSSVFENPPEDDESREKLVDILQAWKTERYKELIKSGTVEPRPRVLKLMDDARAAGRKIAVCSAGTKSSVVLCLENIIGMERFQALDCFLAGDDVKQKKPDPLIYVTAAKMLGVPESNCLVIEDSLVGLKAAVGAGMPCIITYTSSTASQDYTKAIAVYPDLSNVRFEDLDVLLKETVASS